MLSEILCFRLVIGICEKNKFWKSVTKQEWTIKKFTLFQAFCDMFVSNQGVSQAENKYKVKVNVLKQIYN